MHWSCMSVESNADTDKGANIIIDGQLNANDYKKYLFFSLNDVGKIGWMPLEQMELKPEWQVNEDRDNDTDQKVHWALHSDKPILTESALLGSGVLINPGDSIHVVLDKDGYHYTGKGAEALQLQHEILRALKKIKKQQPTKDFFIINSLKDYLNWKSYLDTCEEVSMAILESYKEKVSPFIYDWVKVHTIDRVEEQRAETFLNFNSILMKNSTSGLTQGDMKAICDSTLNGSLAKWLRSKEDYDGMVTYFYQYNRIQVLKKFNFDYGNDSLGVREKRNLFQYDAVKQNFAGQLRERLLQYIVARDIILKLGFETPVTDSILKDYYKQPGFPEYKQWVHHYEDSMRVRSKK